MRIRVSEPKPTKVAVRPDTIAARAAVISGPKGDKGDGVPVETLATDEFGVRFDDGTFFVRANETDGLTSKVAASQPQRLTEESGWQFVISGSNDKAIFGIRNDGSFFPATIGGTATKQRVILVGDSLTEMRGGFGADTALTATLGRDVVNLGRGGQLSSEIVARYGAAPTRVTVTGNVIPASGSVSVTGLSVNLGSSNSDVTRSFVGILAGVPGTLAVTHTGSGGSNSAGTYTTTFTRTTSGAPTPCPAASPFQTGFDLRDLYPILALGRNNIGSSLDPALNLAAVDACVAWSRRSDRMLILSIPPKANGGESGAGPAAKGSERDNLVATNAAVRDKYPTMWVDTAAYLQSADTLTASGITPTAQDLTDISNGITPTSFRIDDLHYNTAADLAINNLIAAEYAARGWSTD